MDIVSIILIVVFLMFSAFFSSSETAFFSLDHMKLKAMRKRRGFKRVNKLLASSSLLMIVILLGNTSVNVALTSLMEGQLNHLGIKSYILSTVLVTAILLFVGEITPKTVAISRVEGTSIFNSRFLAPIFFILKPIAIPIEAISNLILKSLNKVMQNGQSASDDHLAALSSIVSRGEFLERDEKRLIESVLLFSSKEVCNIMSPRTKFVSIRYNQDIKSAVELVKKTKFSKIPVYSKTDDNIVGVIYLRDLFQYIHSPQNIGTKKIKDIMETMYFVPENKSLSEMLEDFQTKNIRIATVVDEYGTAIGIVTVADVLSEIVGEIIDESFDIQKKIIPISKKKYIVSGDVDIDDFNKYFKTKITSEEFGTLAGYVIEQAGDIPDKGYSLEIGKYTVTVRVRMKNHLDKFIVERK